MFKLIISPQKHDESNIDWYSLVNIERNFVRIGIPIQKIAAVKVVESNRKLAILLKTDETAAASIRGLLGMSESEESEGFYSPGSKCTVQ